MSDSILVFIDENLFPTQDNINNELNISKPGSALEKQDVESLFEINGYWPGTLSGNKTGFEFFIDKIEDDALTDFDIKRSDLKQQTHLIELTYRDINEYNLAVIFASVLCKLANGLTFDENNNPRINSTNYKQWIDIVFNENFFVEEISEIEKDTKQVVGFSAEIYRYLKETSGSRLIKISTSRLLTEGIQLELENEFIFKSKAFTVSTLGDEIINVTRYYTLKNNQYNTNSFQQNNELIFTAQKEDEIYLKLVEEEINKWPIVLTLLKAKWKNPGELTFKFVEDRKISITLYTLGVFSEITLSTLDKNYHISPQAKSRIGKLA